MSISYLHDFLVNLTEIRICNRFEYSTTSYISEVVKHIEKIYKLIEKTKLRNLIGLSDSTCEGHTVC